MARQYTGTAGRIENAQVGVFLTYSTASARTFLDRELYLPKTWTDDRPRCERAGIPSGREFGTKPELAIEMISRAIDAGVAASWVTGDAVYGQHYRLRKSLEDRAMSYVLALPAHQRVIATSPASIIGREYRAVALIAALPASAWRTRSAGAGSKGKRRYAWARARINGERDPDAEYWLPARRSLTDPAELGLPPVPRTHTSRSGRTGPCRGSAMGDRGDLPDRERPDRAGPLPSPPVHRLVPAHHLGHARPRLPHRHTVKKGGPNRRQRRARRLEPARDPPPHRSSPHSSSINPPTPNTSCNARTGDEDTNTPPAHTTTDDADTPHERDCSTSPLEPSTRQDHPQRSDSGQTCFCWPFAFARLAVIAGIWRFVQGGCCLLCSAALLSSWRSEALRFDRSVLMLSFHLLDK